MNIGDMVGSLAGLPVGTWAKFGARVFVACDTPADDKALRVGHEAVEAFAVGEEYVGDSRGMRFTICRPPVGAVLPSARYAPEGTWLRDCEGSNWCMGDEPGVAGLGGPDEWGLCIESGLDDYAPFTVIANPREAPEPDDVVHGDADMARLFHVAMDDAVACDDRISAAKEWFRRFQPARFDAGAMHSTPAPPVAHADSVQSPVARMIANTYRTPSGWLCVPHGPVRMTERTPESTNPCRMTWGDAEGATSRRVAPKPEPMPRVDLITTGGDQSWRKARLVNRRPGRVEPVCGWSTYYGDE